MAAGRVTPDLDIAQVGDVATVTVAGTGVIVGTVTCHGTTWEPRTVGGVRMDPAPTRSDAVAAVYDRWNRYENGPAVVPGSTLALARELHQRRGHSNRLSNERNWICDCRRDALEITATDWFAHHRNESTK